jgi:hypothetical protein
LIGQTASTSKDFRRMATTVRCNPPVKAEAAGLAMRRSVRTAED